MEDDYDLSAEGESRESRIRIIVRARPLSAQERRNGDINILQPHGPRSMQVWDPVYFTAVKCSANNNATIDPACWSRYFSFDKCLWSCNPAEFGNVNDSTPVHTVATQDTVYDEIGAPVLKWIMGGFNCCVLAYGQVSIIH